MILRTITLLVVGVAVAAAVYVRLAPMDPDVWNVNPETTGRTGKPNDYLVGPGGDREAIETDVAPAELQRRLDDLLLAMPRTERLAEMPQEGLWTYVQRSAIMGFPDAITLRITPDGAGSRLVIWSRSRYGQSDLGVNAARVRTLLEQAGLS
ncbi:MAG: DUF1499 domain-containing protein [Jannaschia sp.]